MPPHKDHVAELLKRVPSESDWNAKLRDLGLDHDDIRSAYIPETLQEDAGDRGSVQDAAAEVPDLLQLFVSLAARDARTDRSIERQRARANLRTIVTLSVCRVLARRGNDYQTLDAHLKHVAENHYQRRRVYLGARRLHDAAKSLIIRGWQERRVAQLVVIICPSVSTLAALSAECWRRFVDALMRRNPDTDGSEAERCDFPFTLPQLVEYFCQGYQVVEGQPTLGEISSALGYDRTEDPFAIESGTSSSFHHKRQRQSNNPRDRCAPPRPHKRPGTAPARNRGGFRNSGVTTALTPRNGCTFAVGVPHRPAEVDRLDGNRGIPAPASMLVSLDQDDIITLFNVFAVPHGIVLTREQLLWALLPQSRWDEYGNKVLHHVVDARVGGRCHRIFQDRKTLETAVNFCETEGILERLAVEDDRLAYRTGPKMPLNNCEGLDRFDGLAFLCHICPRDGFIDRDSVVVAKTLLRPLRTWFEYLDPESAPQPPTDLVRSVVDTCVVMCSVGTPKDAKLALSIARKLRTETIPLSTRLSLAKAESVFERLSSLEKLSLSDEIAFQAIASAKAEGSLDACAKYFLAHQYFSLAENSLLRNELDVAHMLVDQVTRLLPDPYDEDETWPLLMLRLAHARSSVLGRVLRYKGDFKQARGVLKECLEIGAGARMLNEDNIRRHLADVYCELGETKRALELLRPRLDEIERDGKKNSRRYRRLILPYADACAQSGDSGTALRLWRNVSDQFDQQPATNSTDELDHLRTAISLIMLSYGSESPETLSARVSDALQLIHVYPSFTEPNYYKGLLLNLRGRIYDQLARSDYEAAATCDSGPRHFIPLMGTSGREKFLRKRGS